MPPTRILPWRFPPRSRRPRVTLEHQQIAEPARYLATLAVSGNFFRNAPPEHRPIATASPARLKAHHQGSARPPSAFNQADWLARHTAALNVHNQLWIQRSYEVRIENQNAFRLRGHTATLAGKPDLLVLSGDHVPIIDLKNGQGQPWHRYQVMLYMYALPKASARYRYAKLADEVVYPDRTARVPRGALTSHFIDNLASTIRRLAATTLPKRVPRPRECRFCDISAADCPERLDEASEPKDGTTTDF